MFISGSKWFDPLHLPNHLGLIAVLTH